MNTQRVINWWSLVYFPQKGFTPLHVASKYGSLDVAKPLLQRCAPSDSAGKVGIENKTLTEMCTIELALQFEVVVLREWNPYYRCVWITVSPPHLRYLCFTLEQKKCLRPSCGSNAQLYTFLIRHQCVLVVFDSSCRGCSLKPSHVNSGGNTVIAAYFLYYLLQGKELVSGGIKF